MAFSRGSLVRNNLSDSCRLDFWEEKPNLCLSPVPEHPVATVHKRLHSSNPTDEQVAMFPLENTKLVLILPEAQRSMERERGPRNPAQQMELLTCCCRRPRFGSQPIHHVTHNSISRPKGSEASSGCPGHLYRCAHKLMQAHTATQPHKIKMHGSFLQTGEKGEVR